MTTATTSSVKIVDGKLIMSLPEAQTPVVWQMDLEKAQAASFTVSEDKKEKNFKLIFKDQDGKTDEIAPFDEKQGAVDILMQTSSILQNAHGQIKPNSNTTTIITNDNNKKNDKVSAILALALVVVLITIWTMSATGPDRIGTGGVDPNSATSTSVFNNASSRESSGVAVSADDFLSNR